MKVCYFCNRIHIKTKIMKAILHRFVQKTFLAALLATGGTAQLMAAPGDVVFSETFDSKEAFDVWKTVDVNGGRTWEFLNGKAAYMLDYQTHLPGDDWLISPEFELSSDNVYTLEYTMNILTRPESLRVLLGTSEETSSFTTVLDDYTNATSGASGKKTVKICVKGNGKYRLAFYAYSEADGHRVEVDDITVTETSAKGVPAHVEAFTLTRGEKGAMSAALSFTTPTATAGGDALNGNIGIDVYRNDAAVKQFEDVAPGTAINWTDDAPAQGSNTYRVVTRNADGTGEAASATDFVGCDAPVAVSGLTARLNKQRGATLTWNAPTSSANGGYVDFAALKYIVKRDGTQLGEPVSETTFIDANPVESGQKAVSYTVTPVAGGLEGEAAKSGEVVTGTPLPLPYAESFKNQTMTTPWSVDADVHDFGWTLMPDDEEGEYEEISSQDGDNGILRAESKTAGYGEQSRYVSPLLDLSTLKSAVLKFWFYYARSAWYDPDYDGAIDDNLQVQISTDAGEWKDVEGAKFMLNESSNGWTKCEVHLPQQAAGSFTRIGLLATAESEVTAYRNMYIDNISIDEPDYDVDLAASSLSVDKKRTGIGEPITLTATVFNRGKQATDNYDVQLKLNGETYATLPGKSISPAERIDYTYTFTPALADALGDDQQWSASVVCSNDEYADNNESETVTTSVRTNDVPAVEGLLATRGTAGNALSWTAAGDVEPVAYGDPVSVTDDFDSYTPFAISGFGDWTLYDGDKATTLVSPRIPLSYEHQGEPMAFQVFNNVDAGTWTDNNKDNAFEAHSGNQYLICPCADYPAENDDWLISPRLDGRAQTISFWAHSATYDLEWISLWASSTDNHHDSFVKVSDGDHLSMQENWNKVTFDVPEDTRYFAIRCVRRSVMLFVDDVTYNRYDGATDGATLLGYNIYRDGQKINAGLVTSNAYTDGTAGKESHTYTVTAVYDKGKSVFSNEAVVDAATAVNGVSAADAAGAGAVYNVAGQRMNKTVRGLNIVKTTDGNVRKIMKR